VEEYGTIIVSSVEGQMPAEVRQAVEAAMSGQAGANPIGPGEIEPGNPQTGTPPVVSVPTDESLERILMPGRARTSKAPVVIGILLALLALWLILKVTGRF
jgi:hypothetical protein